MVTHDPAVPGLVVEVGFTLLVFVAILAVVTETYAELVLAATLLAVIWQIVSLFGPSLLLATILVCLGLGLRLALAVLGGLLGDATGVQVRAQLLDDLLTGRGRNRDE